ncbi:MAG: isoprenylcysteine carboxylmethyltransferase family protein [Candidatus Pacebacteria bacterium]|nr:isoprenylcysteine carboxylmethyltransferase family protein [Candidatus Paceibacterota bacterium]
MVEQMARAESGRLVHQVIAHSYLLYLGAIVLGFILDLLYPISFGSTELEALGMLLIVLGTVVIFWAQHSARKSSHLRNLDSHKVCRDHFCVGPYVFTRLPTQYGLSAMALGLSFLEGSLFMVLCTLIAFLIGRFFYIPKQERHLALKYGEAYLEYKRHVKF